VAGVQYATLAFGDEPCLMSRIIHHFRKHCSCHIQGESIVFGSFGRPYIGHALRLAKSPNHYTYTLKVATAVFAETLDNS
jgi:hypothetical protein